MGQRDATKATTYAICGGDVDGGIPTTLCVEAYAFSIPNGEITLKNRKSAALGMLACGSPDARGLATCANEDAAGAGIATAIPSGEIAAKNRKSASLGMLVHEGMGGCGLATCANAGVAGVDVTSGIPSDGKAGEKDVFVAFGMAHHNNEGAPIRVTWHSVTSLGGQIGEARREWSLP